MEMQMQIQIGWLGDCIALTLFTCCYTLVMLPSFQKYDYTGI